MITFEILQQSKKMILLPQMVAINLNKQQALDAGTKAKQKISFTENLYQAEGATMFFIIEEVKETVLDFSRAFVKVLWIYFTLI